MKPYDLAITKAGRVVQVISYPTPDGTVLIRAVPGEPTTAIEVSLDSIGESCRAIGKYAHLAIMSNALPEMLKYEGAYLFDERVVGGPAIIYKVSDDPKSPWRTERWASFGIEIRPQYARDLTTDELVRTNYTLYYRAPHDGFQCPRRELKVRCESVAAAFGALRKECPHANSATCYKDDFGEVARGESYGFAKGTNT